MKRFAFLLAGVMVLAPMSQAEAQQANVQAIAAACSGAAVNCGDVVRAQIAALRAAGVVGPALDAELGLIAETVVQSSAGSPPDARAAAAQVLGEVAAEVQDPQQATAIISAGSQLAADQPVGLPAPPPAAPPPAAPPPVDIS